MSAVEDPPSAQPNEEEVEDLVLSCRYGDLDDVKLFVEKFGFEKVADARDGRGNTVLHMIAANGHNGAHIYLQVVACDVFRTLTRLLSFVDILDYLLPHLPASLLSIANTSGRSTPLHWAVLNTQLETVKSLIKAGGPSLIDIKDAGGKTPLGEAEQSGWDEGAAYLVSAMTLDDGEAEVKETDEAVEEEDVGPDAPVEVEIQDADGGLARMTISGSSGDKSSKETAGESS
jgi:ankyrin repeat protein